MEVHLADLMHKLPVQWPEFDLISAHNWVQHAESPALVLSNIVDKLKIDGRLYICVYQSESFRFFITQLARKILNWEDRATIQELLPYFFPTGFLEFNNPDNLCYENIFDDFFVPFLRPFRYEDLVNYMEELGCEVLIPHVKQTAIYGIDNQQLKIGFIRKRISVLAGAPRDLEQILTPQFDEFNINEIKPEADQRIVATSVALAKATIKVLEARSNAKVGDRTATYERAAFCLGLYRIRGAFSLEIGVRGRHVALQGYMNRFLSGNHSAIKGWESAQQYYESK